MRQETAAMDVTLTVVEGPQAGRVFVFDRHDTFLVGRSVEAHFSLPDDPYFSRVHFLLEVNPPLCRVTDLNSRNKTFVNQRPVKEIDLHNGDRIRAGRTVFRFAAASASASAPPSPEHDVTFIGESIPTPSRSTEPIDLLEEQERAWLRGLCPRVEHYLERFPQLAQRDQSVLDLICGEFELRGIRGEDPAPKEYEQRFPALAGVIRLALSQLGRDPTDARFKSANPVVPGYEIREQIGKGGMGVIFRAARLADGAEVALKTIRPAMTPDSVALERFLREARILKKLEHPHIVRFHDMGEADGVFYIVMELVPGIDAARLVRREGPLPLPRALALMSPILEALAYAHERGFIHRDVKPANLLVYQSEKGESAKLADFGLARTYQASTLCGLTLSGESAGTPQYMSPEQIKNFSKVEPPADQYAAAATMYFLLTGQSLYHALNPNELFEKILLEDPVPLKSRRPDLPPKLGAIIHKALARQPENRFATIREWLAELGRFGSVRES